MRTGVSNQKSVISESVISDQADEDGEVKRVKISIGKITREIATADSRAVKLLGTLPVHSDAFYAVLNTASLSALQEAYLKSANVPKAGTRRAAIGEKLEALMSLALPRASHD